MIKIYFSFFLSFFFVTNVSLSQKEIIKDSKGTDFWLTFLPNYHNNYYQNDPRLKYGDSLYIFITCSEPTTGKIEFWSRDEVYNSINFVITDPTQVYVFKVPSFDYCLTGYNQSSVINHNTTANQNERIAKNSFHITSEKEVTVYGLNQAVTTSDAFLALPTDVLDKRYFILSYDSDGSVDFFPPYNLQGSSTPSEFAIVATEDNTSITIFPSSPTARNGLNVQNIRLNKGEVYLVQANIDPTNLNGDLTGTEIRSSKPIAVFSGHQRAKIPISISVNNPSRDILTEQIPPVSTWGKNSIVVPFAKSQSEIREGTDLFRVLAAEDNTEIYLNGNKVTTINQGEYYERELTQPYFVSSNKPILVGAFKKTCGSGQTYSGDPFFAIMPPTEQYMKSYRVINSQAYELSRNYPNTYQKVYLEQYISIVIPRASWQSFRIDGLPLSAAQIQSIPGSEYVYANIRVNDGVHFCVADTGFGIVVYGYGQANSYGYIGGCNFEVLNFLDPQIAFLQTDSCFVRNGFAFKRRAIDASLNNLITIDSLTQNCYKHYEFRHNDTIYFGFRLIDSLLDGRFAVCVVDTMNLKSQVIEEWIPGFTVALEPSSQGMPYFSSQIAAGKAFCTEINLINYGRFEQIIERMYLKNSKISSNSLTKLTIQPGGKVVVPFCIQFNKDTTIVDTLIIENSCTSRQILALKVVFVSDETKPKVTILKDSCFTYVDVNISDSLEIDKGLRKVEVVQNKNCEITIDEKLPEKVDIKIRIIDIFQDTYLGIVAEDSVGNEIQFYDTIPGFTLSVSNYPRDTIINLGPLPVGSLKCYNLELYNYGNHLLPLEKIYFSKNRNFSIIPSSLPVRIPPRSLVPLTYCFNPNETNTYYDTLNIEFYCTNQKFVFFGIGIPIELESMSNCKVLVKSKIDKSLNNSNHSDIFPNPANRTIYISPDKNFQGELKVTIADIIGNKMLEYTLINFKSSLVEIDISDFPIGTYFVILKDSNGNFMLKNFLKID
ncbi:MAG: T9SS type A sorting domain-containing protein [Ignavibacteria bacterium]|nr:T9SS type A sorting domain-containing protein [Ignavibacteria bacterium]